MALEPAGIDLQAKNFNKYVKQLETIDKLQQDIFDVDSQDVTKAFNSASRAADKYAKELKQIEVANEKISRSQKQFAQGLQGAAAGLVAFATGAVTQFGAESAKLSAQFQGQQIGLENLAASFGQSGSEIQAAIQQASQGTLSGLQAIQAANQGLLLGVAQTPEEFANLTNSALTLGRTLGLDATQSIEQFTSALGRRSLLILDNFGISAQQVNAEIERLAQANFGKVRSELTEAQKQATFMEAALSIAGQAAKTIGEEAGKAQASFDRLNAQAEDLQVTFGTLIQPLGTGIADALSRAGRTAQQFFAFLGAGFAATSTLATGVFNEFGIALSRLGQLVKGEISFAEFNQPLREFSDILDDAGIAATERFKEIASTIEGVSFPNDEAKEFAQNLQDQNDELEQAEVNLEGYQNALKQAESLQLSFTRAAEDSARRLNRQTAKLARDQFGDRIDLLNEQGKEFDQFQEDELESVQKAEQKLNEAREKAGKERLRDQDKLHRELRQAEERFNLDRFQSQRRFGLQDRRLRAAGDVLALQELREDFSLQQQEAQENFDLQDDQRREDGKSQQDTADEQRQEQVKQLEQQFNDLQGGLDQRRTEFLASQTEEFNALLFSQAQQRQAQQEGYREQQEDARINQERQLEDLGRSFAEQEGVTIEGTTAIANQLEKIFGIDGAADTIISGFTTKTESEFSDLFKNVEEIIKSAELGIEGITRAERTANALRQGLGTGGGFGERIGGIPEFQDGGVVGGPIGAPVPAIVHGGETILPTHQQSFSMNAPVIPSQTLNVNMAGGFNITGGEAAGEAATRQAVVDMTDALEIAVKRIGRQI